MNRRLATLALMPLLAAVTACGPPPDRAGIQPQARVTPGIQDPLRTEWPVPPYPTPGRSDWPNQQVLTGHAEKVTALGRKEFKHSFAGVAVDLEADHLIVFRVPDPAFDRAVRETVYPGRVWLRDVLYDEIRIDAWVQQVLADTDYWQRRGVKIRNVGPRWYDSCVGIGVADPARDEPVLEGHYEPGVPVCVEEGHELVFF